MDSAQGGSNHLPAGPDHSLVPAATRVPDKGKRDEWSESGVLCLLEVYESKWLLRNRAKLKGSDWEDIARQVSARCSGMKGLKSPSQCKNKIESMKKRYRAESAAAHEPNSCSSWQFYARMDSLLKGTPNCSAQPKSNHNINLQALPKMENEVEVVGHLQDSNQDDASNTSPPVDVKAVNNDNSDKKESRGDSDGSAPRSKAVKAEERTGKVGNPSKRRKESGNEVADSIRLLAESILKIEQAKIEMYKDSERMRAEAEIKRGEMELKRTEIIAKTQLQIAKLFAKKSQGRSSDVSMCPSDTLVFEDESEKGSNALLARAWSPGWRNADKSLTAFINGPLLEYSINRKKADSATTSLLSPHLHFGELSVRKVFHLVRMKQLVWTNEGNKAGEESCNLFLRSIGLREYSRYLSFNHPCSHERPLLSYLRFFPWVIDEGCFKAWRQGRTGYPLVDAGMRELWATGWLHDRIRVVVSSFFVKVLQLPWRWGMKYFWDTLLDADLESDALGWQYISGTLPDGRELDRIDNPQFEGYKFDPNGEYVRRWLPELARLPTEWIHHPWDAPEPVLQAAGIELGSNYPRPIVEIAAAKARLQEALAEMWQLEAASRAAIENGTEEGLGDSSELPLIDFPEEMQLEVHLEPLRITNNSPVVDRRHEDQMVPSMTSSIVRVEEEEVSTNVGNTAGDSRQEVPSNVNFDAEPEREEVDGGGLRTARDNVVQHFSPARLQIPAQSTADSSSSWTERDGGLVPVWSPPTTSSRSEQFVADDSGIVSSSYLQRHPQSHQLINWRQLSQTL